MSSRLGQIISVLKQEVCSRRNAAIWDQMGIRHPMLGRYTSVCEMLDVLADQNSGAALHKDILTQALLAEHKVRPHSFWTSVLTVAYAPMLIRLRYRIRGDAVSSDDLDQLVINTFLEVISGFPVQQRSRTYLQLRQMTQRQVFKAIRQEQQLQQQQSQLTELTRIIDDFELFEGTSDPYSEVEQEDLAQLLLDLADDVDLPENLDLVIATVIKREKLDHYLERIGAHDGESDRRRVYERFKRRRTRTLNRLREALGEFFCPRFEDDDLCSLEREQIAER